MRFFQNPFFLLIWQKKLYIWNQHQIWRRMVYDSIEMTNLPPTPSLVSTLPSNSSTPLEKSKKKKKETKKKNKRSVENPAFEHEIVCKTPPQVHTPLLPEIELSDSYASGAKDLPDINAVPNKNPNNTIDVGSLPSGKLVTDRWKIIEKLGEGADGAVYRVSDTTMPHMERALKVESNMVVASALKLEYILLTDLQKVKYSVQIITAGKLPEFRFMVIELLGKDLFALKRSLAEPISDGSILKIGMMSLYAIKQLHEIGYIHRDIKPGNLMFGREGRARNTIHLIDYGMVRSYVKKVGDKLKIRKQREKCDFRGTLRYCSLNVHLRKEQSRADDLWALLFSLTEVHFRLPWNKDHDEEKIMRAKKLLPDTTIFLHCPKEFVEIKHYLKRITYAERPNYYKIYEMMWKGMKRNKMQFSTPFEWDKDDNPQTAVEPTTEEEKEKRCLSLDELDYKLFPMIHPDRFKENLIGF